MKTVLLTAAALLCGAVAAGASEGVSGGQFLRITPTAAAASLGEASAVSDGAEAVFYNPAGLQAGAAGFSVSHVRWVMDTAYSSLAYAGRSGGGAYGIGLNYFSVPAIDKYDRLGTRVAGGYDAADMAVTAAYARKITEKLGAGLSAKYVRSSIDSESASAAALDAGLRYAAVPGSLELGLAATNIGTGLKYDGESEPLPAGVKLGGRYAFTYSDDTEGEKKVSLFADLNEMRDPGFYASLGLDMTVSYRSGSSFSVRAGYRTGAEAAGGGSSFGLGMGVKGYAIDYAYSAMGDLGKVHRVSLSVPLGS